MHDTPRPEGDPSQKTIPPELDNARLDKAVKHCFDLPWIKARAWIDTGKVFLEGRLANKQDRLVRSGESLELRMSAPKAQPAPEFDPKRVLYYDRHIVVANKPAGLLTVPHPQSPESATLDRLVHAYLRNVDPDPVRNKASLGAVHRIDKDTSGLVVFARSPLALKALSNQFREHTIEREYYALVHGEMKAQTIRTRLARDNGQGIRGSVPQGRANQQGEELGRLAITHVKVVERLPTATLVACRIETGRTHQIRIHLSEAGHPIVGEQVYIRGYKEPLIPASRVMLHAAELGFLHPETLQAVKWSQGLPNDFKNRLKVLRARAADAE